MTLAGWLVAVLAVIIVEAENADPNLDQNIASLTQQLSDARQAMVVAQDIELTANNQVLRSAPATALAAGDLAVKTYILNNINTSTPGMVQAAVDAARAAATALQTATSKASTIAKEMGYCSTDPSKLPASVLVTVPALTMSFPTAFSTFSQSLASSHSFTFHAWVKWNGGNGDSAIFGAAANMHFNIRGGALYLGFWGNDCAGQTQVPVNQWVHAAFSYSVERKEQTIFFNGRLDSRCTNKSPLTNDGSTQIWLGGFGGDGKTWTFAGYIAKATSLDCSIYESTVPVLMGQAPSDPTFTLIAAQDMNKCLFPQSARTSFKLNADNPLAPCYMDLSKVTSSMADAKGAYSFKLVYTQTDGTTVSVIWSQTSLLSASTITGVKLIQPTDSGGDGCSGFQGLGLSDNSGGAVLDGNGAGGCWWNCIGGMTNWIPGYRGQSEKLMALYVIPPTLAKALLLAESTDAVTVSGSRENLHVKQAHEDAAERGSGPFDDETEMLRRRNLMKRPHHASGAAAGGHHDGAASQDQLTLGEDARDYREAML